MNTTAGVNFFQCCNNTSWHPTGDTFVAIVIGILTIMATILQPLISNTSTGAAWYVFFSLSALPLLTGIFSTPRQNYESADASLHNLPTKTRRGTEGA